MDTTRPYIRDPFSGSPASIFTALAEIVEMVARLALM